MTDLPTIANVEPMPGKRLLIRWRDDHETLVDLTGVIADFKLFSSLADPAEFATVTVAGYGSGVTWACGLDYSADSLHQLAEDQRGWTGTDVARWQDHLGLSNQEAADLLGVALSTFKSLRVPTRSISASVKIACRALETDRSLFQAHYRPRVTGRPGGRASAH
ncbi:MAG: hypothetical protein FD176_3096 [Rhodospirillaceae bacterium]|nr:MAG: hypothetical protein FD176_3096 [Rhodospirillaceae bacterium]TNC98573.1 MAG: hypothetical protein FD119_44 [Stygiobacter sp.]